MRKLCVPIHMNTVTYENIGTYVESCKKSGVERVFVCGIGNVYLKSSKIYTKTDLVKFAIDTFKAEGFEVGVWIGGFGHGVILQHDKGAVTSDMFTPLEGVSGETTKHGFCPYDDNFKEAYAEGVKKIAAMGPHMIMIDDDFRLSLRANFYFGCFCEKHIKEYYRRLGEEMPRDRLEQLIYGGGKNKYRDTYRSLMKDTILGFAKRMREAIDEVDPEIRMAACTSCENWDANGTDIAEIARTFAGNTKPYTRVAGAPYGDWTLIPELDITRLQMKWLRDEGVETMAEGDVYPRPRYNVPSKVLEVFDLCLIAANEGDGILNYVYDYVSKPDYETGYVDRYIRNAPLRTQVEEIFGDKKPCGIEVFQIPNLIENWVLPKEVKHGIHTRLTGACFATCRELISRNAIPVTFDSCDGPVFVAGENAKYIDLNMLKRGAVLDIKAADYLSRRGIDTGFISEESCEPDEEIFIEEGDHLLNIVTAGLRKVVCKEGAKILSKFMPYESPSVYLYENAEGMRFVVVAVDLYASSPKTNFFANYFRQAQLVKGIEWAGQKKLPAVCLKNPNLYMVVSKNEKAMSVALANIFLDDIYEPVVRLDKEYDEIKFANCTGRLEGDKVYLSDIPPYGFVAFEVK